MLKLPSKRKRAGKIKIPELDKTLWEWIEQCESNGMCLTGPLIQAKARSILDSLGHNNDLRLSNGWLSRFKERHGTRVFLLHGKEVMLTQKQHKMHIHKKHIL